MPLPDPAQDHLDRLRQWRVRREPDLSLGFLADQFKRQVARPHKQLAAMVEVWQNLVPADVLEHTRLESFARGILKVTVDSSARLYELDRLLRGGLQQQLITAQKNHGLRKVMLRAGQI